jgi:hypothetical protein
MARVPRTLARKLDRLARRAHRFHRFAHHPLCGAYAGELVRLGRRARVCRGCACALAGAASGGVAGLLLPFAHANTLQIYAAVLALSLASAASASADLVRAGAARRGKLFTRGLPACALVLACSVGVRAGGAAGSGLVLVHAIGAGVGYTHYRRRGPNRTPCSTCPEHGTRAPCSGFARVVRRERAFMRISRRLLAQLG